MANCGLLQNDGTSFFLLNDGTSVILLNDNTCSAEPGQDVGGALFNPYSYRGVGKKKRELEELEEKVEVLETQIEDIRAQENLAEVRLAAADSQKAEREARQREQVLAGMLAQRQRELEQTEARIDRLKLELL